MTAYELINKLFIDNNYYKSDNFPSNDEVLEMYQELDWKEKVYFSKLLQENIKESRYGSVHNFSFDSLSSFISMEKSRIEHNDGGVEEQFLKTYFFDGDEIKDLSNLEKENLLKMGNLCEGSNGNDSYWLYHSHNSFDVGKIKRDFSIKIGIAAWSMDDASKIYDTIIPYLVDNEYDICFKIPKSYNIEEHLKRDVEGNLFTIYTKSDKQAFQIIKDLDKILEDASLDVYKKTNKAYVEVGNSGIIGAIMDSKPYSANYISRETTDYDVSRNHREDNFERLKSLLEDEGLIYGRSIESNENKEKELLFGKYKSLRPKITKEDIINIEEQRLGDKTAYILGHYNVSEEDLPLIFDKDKGISDSEALVTLYSYGYSPFKILDILSSSKEESVYSINHSGDDINLIDIVFDNKDDYFKLLDNLKERDLNSFSNIFNSLLDDYLHEISFSKTKSNEEKYEKYSLFIKEQFNYLIDNKTSLLEGYHINNLAVTSLLKSDKELLQNFFDLDLVDKREGQKIFENRLFFTIKNDEEFNKMNNLFNDIKDIGFDIYLPEKDDFIKDLRNIRSDYSKVRFIENFFDEDSYFANLNKDTFKDYSLSLVDDFVKELFMEKDRGELKGIDLGYSIREYLEEFNNLSSFEKEIRFKFIEKSIDCDLVSNNSLKENIESAINRSYYGENFEEFIKFVNFAKDKDIKLEFENYQFRDDLKKRDISLEI